MQFNYPQICLNLLNGLPERTKDVLSGRFGLYRPAGGGRHGPRGTLESIGQKYGITRERVRQIEEDGLERIKPKLKQYQRVSQCFREYLKDQGGLKKEDLLLEKLGGDEFKNEAYFLLTLGEDFDRFGETEDFYSFWIINQNSLVLAKKVINSLFNLLKKTKKLLTLNDFKDNSKLSETALISYLEISKKILENKDNLFGLKEWPEINPRGVKDRAYLVFKKENKPLHFAQVAKLIEGSLVQTVHNELIKDPRFVLVGRGVYALSEWGYSPGQVRDVILKVLKETKKPLTKEEILERVLKQRLVKENTVLLNLSNKKYFLRNLKGKYWVKEA